MDKLVLIGKIDTDEGNVAIIQNGNRWGNMLSVEIGDFIEKNNDKLSSLYDKEVDEDLGYRINTREDNIQLRYYISDVEIKSKEEIEEKYLQKLLGSIDISVENIGYSEYTITGYSTENFTLGGHDLEKIFSNYIGKYVCIIVEKVLL
ncbi:MAG TPA: hypothetical protein DEP51_04105 [Clostridiales bacterium]|nr:hypothetical protein [Clostridiales bacterium]